MSIFKAYDIRGVYPDDLNEGVAYRLGRAFVALRQNEAGDRPLTLVVGADMRLSSPALKKELIRGLTEQGADVVDVGLISTPTFYFAVAFYGYDGGIQVSASHNPKQYNGFKLVRAKGVPVSRDTGMKDLEVAVVAGATGGVSFSSKARMQGLQEKERPQGHPKPGMVTEKHGVLADAVREETRGLDASKIRPLKVVVDAANAMGALDIEGIFGGLPCELVRLNFDLDGTFPNHPADPLVEENLQQLQAAVREHGADLGLAPDGDGDRIFFLDETGAVIRQEIVRGIMAQLALREHPGATVCYDIRPGRITRDLIEQAGGRAIVTPVGHSLIKEVMLKENAVFGGESSGHYFYQFPFGTFEAPIRLIRQFLQFVSEQGKPVSQIVAPYKKYFHSGEINSDVADVKIVLERIKTQYADGQLNFLDGVTVEYPDWWFNVRGSNTEPLIRLNLEAKTPELMAAKRDEVLALIRQ